MFPGRRKVFIQRLCEEPLTAEGANQWVYKCKDVQTKCVLLLILAQSNIKSIG